MLCSRIQSIFVKFALNEQKTVLEKFGVKLDVKGLGFIRFNNGRRLCTSEKKHNLDSSRFSKGAISWTEETQRDALETLGKKLGVKELDDWYSVSATTVRNELSFLRKYGSLLEALKTLYPQHHWDPLRFSRAYNGYWTDENAQRDALERIGREKFGVKTLDDWYSVSVMSLRREFSFLSKYASLYEALSTLYPKHDWDPLKFLMVPRGYWTDESSQRKALERVGREKFGVEELDDWYSIPVEHVHRELSFILSHYRGSLFDALKRLYPQHNWDAVRFSRVPHGYWSQPDTVEYYRNLFTEWKKTLCIRTVRDWYELPPQKVKLLKRASVGIFGSQRKMLEVWFPDIVWHTVFTSQLELQSLLKHAIADYTIKYYRYSDEPVQALTQQDVYKLLEIQRAS